MNETAKTLSFLVAAAAAVVLAVVTRPTLPVQKKEDFRNKLLYPGFTDPLAVTALEITEYDEQRGEIIPFRVAQAEVKGKTRWSIPSHDDYPADAKDQVASAATGLMGLRILEMVSDDQGDQREYGVLDPDPKARKLGDTGVGEKVVMKDKGGKDVLALVIGKEVPGRTGLRYVRKAGEAPIYVVEAKTDKLSTKFDDWIERNLLGINSFDTKRLWIRDHSVDQLNMTLVQRGETVIEYNDTGEPKWKLADDRKFAASDKNPAGEWTPVKLPDDQELNSAKLDDLKTALDDLKIVDVSRKPKGLSAGLKAAADFTTNREAVQSLFEMGFFPAKLDGQAELYSNDGEIRVVMKNGVEYILRFGQVTGGGPTKKDDEKDAEKGKEKEPGGGLNRFLFVMAQFNPDIIPKPQLEPLPEAKKETEKKPDEKKPAEKKPEEAKKLEKAKPEEKRDAEKSPEKQANEQKKDDKQTDDAKKAEAATAASKAAADKAERERIEKENKRKQDEYEQKIADGKKKVDELNARFADWYYVIADDVYRKIHLAHDDIFKKKEKPKDEKKAADEHAGHDHDAPGGTATPSDMLEQLKKEGPTGKP